MQNSNFWLQLVKFAKKIFSMFSSGQLIFGGIFLIVFIIIMIFSYRKDIAIHKIYYKGNYKVLLAFIVFIALLFVIKVFLKR